MWCYTRWHSRNIRLLYCRYAQEGRSPRGDVFLPSVSAPSSVARVIKAPLGVSHPAIGNRDSLFLSHSAAAKRVRESFRLIRLSLSPSLSLSVSDYCHQCRNRGGGRVLCEMYKVSQYYFPPTLLELSFWRNYGTEVMILLFSAGFDQFLSIVRLRSVLSINFYQYRIYHVFALASLGDLLRFATKFSCRSHIALCMHFHCKIYSVG